MDTKNNAAGVPEGWTVEMGGNAVPGAAVVVRNADGRMASIHKQVASPADRLLIEFFRDLAAAPAPTSQQGQEPRCEHCDGTGSVHRADGEYMGECDCGGAAPTAAGQELQAFAQKLTAAQVPLDPEFVRIYHENAWDLYSSDAPASSKPAGEVLADDQIEDAIVKEVHEAILDACKGADTYMAALIGARKIAALKGITSSDAGEEKGQQ